MTAATVAAPAPKPKAFAVRFRELERWSVAFFRQLDWRWPPEVIQPIGTALKHRRLDVDPTIDRVDVPIIEKITFGGQLFITDPGKRANYKGRLFWARRGDLIYSKIRVKQGSLAVVPDDIESVAVSSEYPVYAVDASRADGKYLELVIRSKAFMHYLEGLSHGGSTKTRIAPETFEALEVPLPPLSVQRGIVSAWARAQGEVADTRRRIAELEDKIEADFLADLGLTKPKRGKLPKTFAVRWHELERWSVMFNQLASVNVDISVGKYPVSTLGDVAAVSYGIQKCPANRPGQHARPYLRVANVQRGELDLREVKTINVPDTEMATYRLQPGDLLFVEGNGSRAELGRCALWHGEIEDCVHQNHILKVRPDPEPLLSDYAMTWFNTDAGKEHFFRNVKSSSGLGSINSSELRAAPIPLPPLPVQRRLVAKVAAQRQKIAAMKAEAQQKTEQAQAEVEAMILGERALESVSTASADR